jgi:hypothetical protein
MKIRDFLYIVIIGLALVVGWLLFDKKQRAEKANRIIKRLRKENHEIKAAYLNLFQKYLESRQNMDVGLIEEVEKLKSRFSQLDFEVHVELEGLIKEMNDGKASEAIRRMAKVVESKLKQKAKKENKQIKQGMLHNLLSSALEIGWIDKRQFENGLLLKEMRNKESHELDVQSDSKTIGQCIYAGIDILYCL